MACWGDERATNRATSTSRGRLGPADVILASWEGGRMAPTLEERSWRVRSAPISSAAREAVSVLPRSNASWASNCKEGSHEVEGVVRRQRPQARGRVRQRSG
jgi:hypothetical protein